MSVVLLLLSDVEVVVGAVATQDITTAGLSLTTVAATGDGDLIEPDTFLLVRNGGGSPVVVTPVVQFVDRLGNPSLSTPVTVTAGSDSFIGPFPREFYANVDGVVEVNYSAVAGVTVAALRLG